MASYRPTDPSLWQGRQDAKAFEYLYQTVTCVDVEAPAFKNLPAGPALLGFASDEGIRRNQGRPGSATGPDHIRSSLARLALPQAISLNDWGTVCCDDEDLETAQALLGKHVHRLLTQQHLPVVLGGGHETAWGHYQGIREYLGNQALTIINIDAHFDLRDPLPGQLGSSGTPFRQIAQDCQAKQLPFDYHVLGIQPLANTRSLYQIAKHLQVAYLPAADFYAQGNKIALDHLDLCLAQERPIYLSICLDAFAAHIAPGVSAPQPLGLLPEHVLPLLHRLRESQQLIAIDIVELSPPFDIDGRTAKLAAQVLAALLLST